MPPIIAGLVNQLIFKPVVSPLVRIVCGLLAIPLFRFLVHRVLRVRTEDAEMEKDLEYWFRGAVLLLAATKNLENLIFEALFGWVDGRADWFTLALRVLLAIGVIESMPDQDLFGLVHQGPPHVKCSVSGLREAWCRRLDFLRGACVVHLKRSSPVLVIMCVVIGGKSGEPDRLVGWCCYGLAIAQYLIIALTTDRERATGLLAELNDELIPGRAEQLRRAASDSAAFCEDGECEDGQTRK